MVIDRDKHNKYVATGFQPVQQVTEGTTLQSNTGNTSSTTSGSASTSTIVINGGGGMTNALEEKLSGIEAGALVNLNAYSNITILNGTVEAGTITALAETDTARISTITPIVCSLVDGVILLTFDDTNYATKLYVIDSIDDLIGAAPGALDTLEELALALGDDPNFATTVTNMIANVSNRVDTIEDTYAKLTDITVTNITDLNSNWDSLLLNPPTDYVTRWPSWGEVTDKPTWIGDTKPTYTAEEIGALTLAAADDLYVSIDGDTMTGTLIVPTVCVRGPFTGVPEPGQTGELILFKYGNVNVGSVSTDGLDLSINNSTTFGTIHISTLNDNNLYYNDAHVLTSANYGQYIDIDAGGITQDFADSRYVNVTGDTMTGTLIAPNYYTTKGDGNRYSRLTVSGMRLMASPTAGAIMGMMSYTNDENTLLGYVAGVWTELDQLNHYYFYGGTDFLNPYMIITPTGNVGIGTTSPTAKLSVNGDITIPVTKATVDGSVPYAGSTLTISSMDLLSNYKSFIGGVYIQPNWYFGISVRHRNGYGNGNLYGLWIYTSLNAAGGLAYRKLQGTWTTKRVLLDSVNYTGLIGNSFVKKSGDTMTGALTFQTSTQAYDPVGILYENNSGRIGCSSVGGLGLYAKDKLYFRPGWTSSSSTTYGVVIGSATFTYNSNKIWHAGNDGSGSGLDADTLDGVHNGYVTAMRLDGIYTGGGGMQQPSYFAGRGKGIFLNMMNEPVTYSDVIYIDAYGGHDVPYVNAIAFQKASGAHGTVYHARAAHNGSSWGTWYPFIDSYNIGSYNAGSATKLRTARTITLSGAVTGSASFDGTANVTIATKYKGSYMPYLISGNNSVLNPTLYNSTMFILLNGTSNSTRTVNLPSLGMMLTYVGSTSSWFAVLLTIVTCNTNYGTWAITKPATASGATASNYYPKYFYNMSGGNVSLLGLSGPGKRMQILLYYHGSTDYTAQQIS